MCCIPCYYAAAAFRRGRADLSKYLPNGIAYPTVADQIIFVPMRK